MLFWLVGFRPNSYARQEPPSAVARRTRLRAQSPDPFGALPPGGGHWGVTGWAAGKNLRRGSAQKASPGGGAPRSESKIQ